ncbi:MAG: hypothetical protein K0R98_642 [Rickettsiaceae bacterium]|jgi:endogenous inhibitor of DNA gyrase (YacG/DUF329 family)|nr:hypothetical protein [Rickettsiaceae bacterium]
MSKCATCGKPVTEQYKPFCSKRCADVDLGRWLNESYVVQTNEIPDEEDTQITENDDFDK